MQISKRKSSLLRWLILAVILVGSMIIHYLHLHGGTGYPSVHAICPYGGLENLWAWFAGQANIQKIFSGTMALFFLTIIFAMIFRRSFCGSICPLGALQELIGLFTRKKVKMPRKVDKPLRGLKYIILILSAFMAWITASLWLTPYDPWAAFSHIFSGENLFLEFGVGMVLLLLTIAASPFISRAFCKYLCPAGALYALIGRISPLKIERDANTCINCNACSRVCPMDIDVANCSDVKSTECISCNRCIDVCPGADTMISAKIGKKRVNPLIVIIVSVAVFFGSIAILDAVGLYTVSLPTAAQVVDNQDYIQIVDLRGSMTIEQGAQYVGMNLADFYDIMEIPQTVQKDTQLKAIIQFVPGYDFHSIKALNGK